jgi:hypothetical protein
MDLLNSTLNYLKDFAATAEQNYNVNPWIFTVLFFGSAIPLYYGYYRIAKSVITVEKGKIKRKKLDKKELKIGLTISIIAWWLPYAYVILFGKLPANLWILFILFMIVMGVFFVRSIFKKISEVKKETD